MYVEYAQYQGLADIKFDLHQNEQQIVLHAKDFNIHRIMLYQVYISFLRFRRIANAIARYR